MKCCVFGSSLLDFWFLFFNFLLFSVKVLAAGTEILSSIQIIYYHSINICRMVSSSVTKTFLFVGDDYLKGQPLF